MEKATTMVYIAHTPANGHPDPVICHLRNTARLARASAAAFAPFEAEIAALAHDLGKYGRPFQNRLRGKASGVDHWSPGAWFLLQRYRELGFAPALAVQGHHIGLQSATKSNLDALNPARLAIDHPLKLTLSEPDPAVLEACYKADGGIFPEPAPGASSRFIEHLRSNLAVAAMLDVRMIFSSLVDADYLATEAHFNRARDGAYAFRPPGRRLDPKWALGRLDSYLSAVRSASMADPQVRALREDLQRACAEAATCPPGLFTLTAPTGSGKTIAMLVFALRHALAHGLRRIIVVLPFLSLIEQTAGVYRQIFGDDHETPYVLEDHSMTDTDPGDENEHAHLLTQNWDAPIIVTTSVRFCESLFANRPSACRKLHNISGSVILFDEVQTLPAHLAVPTLAALSHLMGSYGCTVVLSTATQPAFTSLSTHVARHAPAGWKSAEIVRPELNLFARVQRVRVHWPREGETSSLEEIADKMLECPRVLTIVNVKRHSRRLYEIIASREPNGLYHLSTDMCPAHRTTVLDEIKQCLRSQPEQPLRVVSTQCVEAGVDLDFPVVFRAWGPLEALAQAAGRCNRDGRLPQGDFYVFLPPAEEEIYPGQAYKMAAIEVKKLFRERGGCLDLQDPNLFQDYYQEFYALADIGSEEGKYLFEFVKTYDFVEVANHYRLIKNDTINVLVPYPRRISDYRELRDIALTRGLSRDWLRRARPLTVNLYRTSRKPARTAGTDWLEPIRYRGMETGWYVYLNEEHYSDALGLVAPEVQEFLIA